jgi:hypothetical protein
MRRAAVAATRGPRLLRAHAVSATHPQPRSVARVLVRTAARSSCGTACTAASTHRGHAAAAAAAAAGGGGGATGADGTGVQPTGSRGVPAGTWWPAARAASNCRLASYALHTAHVSHERNTQTSDT